MYKHKQIEAKWLSYWETIKLHSKYNSNKPKFYILDMFPYPSGTGLHVGHILGYTGTDICSRFYKMNGYNVLHPMGWDAFGLPAENYAIKTKTHPAITTQKAIQNFKRQINNLGFSYDWNCEVDTSSSQYYKWTQWLFLLFFKNGLAYQKMASVNWCLSCQTVLAREQVIDGKCERCDSNVVQKELKQWFLKITKYAERLLADLDKLDWPDKIKEMQINWIGKSIGDLIKFKISCSELVNNAQKDLPLDISVFTTRADTLFGATYLVIAPEHPILGYYKNSITNFDEVQKYIQSIRYKNELERTGLAQEKTGVELKGLKVVHPITKTELSIWVADYVLMSYGTGAIMAVPAHDQRDFEFAKKFNLPIKIVICPNYPNPICPILDAAYTGSGHLVDSGDFIGLDSKSGQAEISKHLLQIGAGVRSVQYKLRDWLISRQRYWGCPIPLTFCSNCEVQIKNSEIDLKTLSVGEIENPGWVPVLDSNLPVTLPEDVDFLPTGESPLARSKSFHNVSCPRCKSTVNVRAESDTMDTFVDSSWYFLRYIDPLNTQEFAAQDKIKQWLPVDLYVGGAEHAVMHLLYSRFFIKALKDLQIVDFDEPFIKLVNQGLVLGENNQKMSKSKGNTVNPDDIIEAYGADSIRLYEMFMGPFADSKPWSTKNIIGVRRFLDRVWKIYETLDKIKPREMLSSIPLDKNITRDDKQLDILTQKTIIKVTNDIKEFKFNTCVSSLMVLVNALEKQPLLKHYESLILLLSPFAPYITEEIWSQLHPEKYKQLDYSILQEEWPSANLDIISDDKVTIIVQINGKLRDTVEININTPQSDVEKIVFNRPKVLKFLGDQKPKKIILAPNKAINLVV